MIKRSMLAAFWLLLSTNSYAQTEHSEYEQALSLYTEQQYVEAEITVKNSIQSNPDYLPARLLLGKILLQQGQLSAAEKEFTLSLEMRADSYIVVLPLVETKLLLNQPEQALALLDKYQQLQGEEKYYLLKGNAEKAKREYLKAEKSYQLALNIHGDSAERLTAMADLNYKKDNHQVALEIVNKALVVKDLYIPALLLKAELLKNQKSYEQALVQYIAVLKIESNNKQAIFGQASVLLAQDKIDEALLLAVRLRKLAPEDPYSKLLHSSLLTLQGNLSEGKQLLLNIQQQILGLSDKQREEQEVLLLSASVDFINQNFQQARIKLQRYLRDFGEKTLVRRHLATIELRDGKLTQAKEHIEKALFLSPNEPEILLIASVIYQQVQTPLEYLAFIEKAFEQHSEHTLIKDKYIAALINTRRYDKAEILLKDAANEAPLTSKTTLGYLQLQQEKYDDARLTTQYLLDNYPNKVEVLQLAGELSIKIGQQQDAIVLLNQALVLDEKFRPAIIALAGISLNAREFDKTEQYYQKVLNFYPNDADVLQLYSSLAISQQRYRLAIKLLTALPKAYLHSKQNLSALLSLYLATEQLDLAQKSVEALRELDPFDQDYLLARSQLEQKQGSIEKAKKTLKILFGAIYDQADRLEKVATLQLNLGDLTGAKNTITRFTELNDSESKYLITRLNIAQNKFEQVATTFAALTDEENKTPKWIELHAHFLLVTNQQEQALPIIVSLFEQYQQREHLQQLAQIYAAQSNTVELTSLLSEWLNSNPSDSWAVAQLSALAEKSGDTMLAIKTLENYPYINQQPFFLNNLATLYQDQDKEKALNFAQLAHQLQPKFAAINDTLGWLLVINGQLEKGLSYLREAISRDSNKATYHYHLAIALAKLDRIELAKVSRAKAIALDADHTLLVELEQLL